MDKELSLEEKINEIHEVLPLLRTIGDILVPRAEVLKRTGFNKNTFNDKDRYEELGKRKTLLSIREVAAVPKPGKRRKKVR